MTLIIGDIQKGLDFIVEAATFSKGDIEFDSSESHISTDQSDGSSLYEFVHKFYLSSDRGRKSPDVTLRYNAIVDRNETPHDRNEDFWYSLDQAAKKAGVRLNVIEQSIAYQGDEEAPLFSGKRKRAELPDRFDLHEVKQIGSLLGISENRIMNYLTKHDNDYNFSRYVMFRHQVLDMFGWFRGEQKRRKELVYAAITQHTNK